MEQHDRTARAAAWALAGTFCALAMGWAGVPAPAQGGVAAAGAAAPAATWRDAIRPDLVRRIHGILDGAGGEGDPAAAAALKELGADALASLCAVLWCVPPPRVEPPLVRDPDARDRRLLEHALLALPRDRLRGFLAGVGGADATFADRLRVVRLLGDVGSAADVELLLDTMGGMDALHRSVPAAWRAFRYAVAAIVRRDGRAASQLAGRWADVADGLGAHVIHAVAESDAPQALDLLEALLGSDAAQDELLALQIARLGARAPARVGTRARGVLRKHLESGPAGLRAAAAEALSALHDVASFDLLVRALRAEDRRVTRSAFDALQRMSGARLPPDPRRWRRWFDDEEHWLQNGYPALREQLWSDDPAEVISTLRAVGRHRLFRDELVPDLVELLRKGAKGVRREACLVLARLRAPQALEPLVGLLDEREDPEVRRTAWLALKSISGASFEADPRVWNDWIARVTRGW